MTMRTGKVQLCWGLVFITSFVLSFVLSLFIYKYRYLLFTDVETQNELFIRTRLLEAESTWKIGKAKKNESRLDFEVLKIHPWQHPHRRSFWDYFTPNFDCPHITQRVGRLGKGGKWICGLNHLRKKTTPCIVYSYGISQDTTFEEEILEETECLVYMYDPSVKTHNVELLRKYPEKAAFYPVGISSANSKKLRTLKSTMNKHYHDFIDILKIDIDGGEFKSLQRVKSDFPNGFPFAQLLVTLHIKKFPNRTIEKLTKWYEMLEGGGLRAFKNEPNMGAPLKCFEFSFINTAVDNYFLHAYHKENEN